MDNESRKASNKFGDIDTIAIFIVFFLVFIFGSIFYWSFEFPNGEPSLLGYFVFYWKSILFLPPSFEIDMEENTYLNFHL